MSTPPDPSKSDPPLPHRCSPSERRDQSSRRGGSGPDNTAAGTPPPPPHHHAAGGEPMTLDEAVRLHRAARHGDDLLPEAILAGGLPLPELPLAGSMGVLAPPQGLGGGGRGGFGGRDDSHPPAPLVGRLPSAVGTPTADILEEARRVVEEVDATLRLRGRGRTDRAPGGGGRSFRSLPPRSSGRRRPRSPDPGTDRQ